VLPELPPDVLPELAFELPPDVLPEPPLELAFELPPDVLPEPPLETEPPLEVPPASLVPPLPLAAPLPLEVDPTEPDADPPSVVVWGVPEVEVPHAAVNANAIAKVAPRVSYARIRPFIYLLQTTVKSDDCTRQSRVVGPHAARRWSITECPGTLSWSARRGMATGDTTQVLPIPGHQNNASRVDGLIRPCGGECWRLGHGQVLTILADLVAYENTVTERPALTESGFSCWARS
jgi:hypothetical protein